MVLPLYDKNPTKSKATATRWLIWINVVMFLLASWLESRGVTWIASAYGMVPSRLTADFQGEIPKIFTSMFLHGGWSHLILNLLYLHIFGDNVEDALGKSRFVLFYALSGWGAAAAQYLVNPLSPIPMVGASGAIAGVLGAYLIFFPRAPVVVFNPFILPFPILPFPAWLVIGWWFFLNVLGQLFSHESPVAHLAHIGGFVTGLFLARGSLKKQRSSRPAYEEGQEVFPGLGNTQARQVKRPIFSKGDEPFWRP
ncbi:MAG TPA: rhomboid family intramembrane serine protease [Polyangiaceae bacterium]|nr:rhomboid family intramembrane serine protease [Polyangiaceae bacterium]